MGDTIRSLEYQRSQMCPSNKEDELDSDSPPTSITEQRDEGIYKVCIMHNSYSIGILRNERRRLVLK